ncbi:hypothetical protein [Arthrobacter sp. M4]|uniref:hypothetical protein n=1 Tax=Arthrobacter sp. M4 TaxID=218160 RepID=UPI001CDBB08D|nr:hypothetical protein [Arthrobacter sp. M4]MCA4132468.1 hypothetical protein [Arthrobacter sp. M4]
MDADTAMLAAQAFAAAAAEGNAPAGQRAVAWARKALAIYPSSIEFKLALAANASPKRSCYLLTLHRNISDLGAGQKFPHLVDE